jgi:cytochrome c-type biogenesis protein CcmF
MTQILGNIGLCLAVLSATAAVFAALAGGRFGSAYLLRLSRLLIAAVAGFLVLASIGLIMALLGSDFSIAYVASYTERALPVGYKLAAFWAGQEGSLLLWAVLLATMAVIFVFWHRIETPLEAAASLTALSLSLLFFAALMLFAANPFTPLTQIPADGRGLNPMLQDPWMIAHPPLLFLGYAGYTIPFVMMIGALLARRRDSEWLAAMRPWAIVSWLFLSVGILMGAQWAYLELGWGGYWAWDPVENASLLPWLTGTALLHSIMVQQHRGMFKRWNVFLIAATFVLCIFGTYLTRSGVIQSVHAFEGSLVSTFFLGFLAVLVLVSFVLFLISRKVLLPEHSLEGLLGREGMFLATNVLLLGMTLLTLVGTIFPLLSRTVASQEITVGVNYYNKVVAPLGLLLVALMAMGPLLTYGPQASARLARGLIVPGIAAGIVGAGLLVAGIRNPWAIACGAISTIAVFTLVSDFARTVRHRMSANHESLLAAVVRLLDSNHRRYGGQVAHVGILLIVIGVTGSSLFSINETRQLKPGESATVAGRTISFVNLEEVRHVNFTAVQAEVRLTEPDGRVATLRPQRRFYDKTEQPNSEVAIRSTWREDLYLNLAGWEAGGAVTAIQVIVNPLVSMLWTGGIVLTIGGVICIIPRFTRQPQSESTLSLKPAHRPEKRRGGKSKDRVPASV